MKNDEDFFADDKKGDEELLDFEFEELSDEEFENDMDLSASQDEPIELVNVVDKGQPPNQTESDDFSELLDEQAFSKHVEANQGSDVASSDAPHAVQQDEPLTLEKDVTTPVEDAAHSEMGDTDFELLEDDLETIADAELFGETTVDSEDFAEPETAQAPSETPEPTALEQETPDTSAELSPQEQEEPPPSPIEQVEEEPPMATSPAQEPGQIPGISEERIEAIITQVVQDTVERVVRETVADVAEKVITEAIEALKETFESTKH